MEITMKSFYTKFLRITQDLDEEAIYKICCHLHYTIANYLHSLDVFDKHRTFKLEVGATDDEIVIRIHQNTSPVFYLNALWNIPSNGFSKFKDIDGLELDNLCINVLNACYAFPLLIYVTPESFAGEFKTMIDSLR
jgi:hypothetical protein